jgi:hypothetical protein
VTRRGSERLGYDLELTHPRRRTRYVEVKGSTADERAVMVTPNEVDFAQNNHSEVALFVLSRINANYVDGGAQCSGGVEHVEDPWLADDSRLTTVRLRYTLDRN